MVRLLGLVFEVRRAIADQKGVTAMEYGVIAAATIVAITGALLLIGPQLTTIFEQVDSALPPPE